MFSIFGCNWNVPYNSLFSFSCPLLTSIHVSFPPPNGALGFKRTLLLTGKLLQPTDFLSKHAIFEESVPVRMILYSGKDDSKAERRIREVGWIVWLIQCFKIFHFIVHFIIAGKYDMMSWDSSCFLASWLEHCKKHAIIFRSFFSFF